MQLLVTTKTEGRRCNIYWNVFI